MSAPKVTPKGVESVIASEFYFTGLEAVFSSESMNVAVEDDGKFCLSLDESGPLGLLTFCVLVLKNGHTVTGEAYCADPARFNADTGRSEARVAAINKLWPMVVYAERERLATPAAIATAAIARQFIADNHVSCPEATTNDRVYENAPELVEKLADVVGYYKHLEDAE